MRALGGNSEAQVSPLDVAIEPDPSNVKCFAEYTLFMMKAHVNLGIQQISMKNSDNVHMNITLNDGVMECFRKCMKYMTACQHK